jgi:hypothetical protein
LVGREQSPKTLYQRRTGLIIDRPLPRLLSHPNQDEITVHGDHFGQKDSPAEIGRPLQHFLRRVTT